VFRPQVEHLPGDEVEKGQALLHGQEAFRAIEPHTGAQPAIEFHQQRLPQQFRVRNHIPGNLVPRWQVWHGLNLAFGNHSGFAGNKARIMMVKGCDCRLAHAGLAHPALKLGKKTLCHATAHEYQIAPALGIRQIQMTRVLRRDGVVFGLIENRKSRICC